MLIREVAYAGLSKVERAELHAALRRVAPGAGGRRAARDPRLPPRPRGAAARRARRRAAGGARARGRGRARGGRPPRARARGEPLRPQAAPARGRARADARAPLPRRARRVADERLPGGLGRDGARAARRRTRSGDRALEGKALTALAEVALLRDADLPQATELVDARARGCCPTTTRPASTRSTCASRIAWWVGDFEAEEQFAPRRSRSRTGSSARTWRRHALDELAHVYRTPARHERGRRAAERASSSPRRAAASSRAPRRSASWASSTCAAASTSRRSRSTPTRASCSPSRRQRWMHRARAERAGAAASSSGKPARAERLLREAIRMLKPLEDRGALVREPAAARPGAARGRASRRGRAVRAGGARDGRRAGPAARGRRRG